MQNTKKIENLTNEELNKICNRIADLLHNSLQSAMRSELKISEVCLIRGDIACNLMISSVVDFLAEVIFMAHRAINVHKEGVKMDDIFESVFRDLRERLIKFKNHS